MNFSSFPATNPQLENHHQRNTFACRFMSFSL